MLENKEDYDKNNMGIGDWGLGIGPNPHFQSHIFNFKTNN